MVTTDCERVIPDPELQSWHKQFHIWSEWVKSREYAEAFRVFYRAGSVPLNRYPPSLVRTNKKNGTLEVAHLTGTYDWKDFQDPEFLESAIYSRNLAKWRQKIEKAQHKESYRINRPDFSRRLDFSFGGKPVFQIIGWLIIILTTVYLVSNPYTMDVYPYGYGVLFLAGTVCMVYGVVKTASILFRLFHTVGGLYAGLFCLTLFGILPVEMIIFIIPLIILIPFLFLLISIKLLWIRLKAGAAGYGWNEGTDYYRKKRW